MESSAEKNFLNLFKISKKIASAETDAPLWITWFNKFYSSFIGADEKTYHYNCFREYFTLNKDVYIKPIFYDDSSDESKMMVNDLHLRSNEMFPFPGSDTVKTSSINCTGHVIYFDKNNFRLRAVSYPIGKIYQTALKIRKNRGKNDSSSQVLPVKFLLRLYEVFYDLAEDDSKVKLMVSINLLKDELCDDGDEKEDDTGDTFNGMGSMIEKVMKGLGMEGKMDGKSITDVMEKIMNSDTGKNIMKTGKDILESAGGDKEQSLPDLLKKVGSALQDETNLSKIQDNCNDVGEIVKTIPFLNDIMKNEVPTESVAASEIVCIKPSEQM